MLVISFTETAKRSKRKGFDRASRLRHFIIYMSYEKRVTIHKFVRRRALHAVRPFCRCLAHCVRQLFIFRQCLLSQRCFNVSMVIDLIVKSTVWRLCLYISTAGQAACFETAPIYRVIHKSLRDFRTRLHNNQDRHGRKEHINR